MQAARPGTVYASEDVRDLLGGSGLLVEERGSYALKGIPRPMPLFQISV
jgi:class 3 adenylate cyclase